MPPTDQRRVDPIDPDPVLPSVFFWLCLFVAVAVFAAVFLAPKLVGVHRLDVELAEVSHAAHQARRHNEFLDRVIVALKNDPDFTAEVARFDLRTTLPDEEQLPVLPVRPAPQAALQPPVAASQDAWWLPLALQINADRRLSDIALVVAGALVIVAFTFFSPTRKPCRAAHSSARHSAGRRRARAAARSAKR